MEHTVDNEELEPELIIFSIQIYFCLRKYQSVPFFYIRVHHNHIMDIIKQVTCLKLKDKK